HLRLSNRLDARATGQRRERNIGVARADWRLTFQRVAKQVGSEAGSVQGSRRIVCRSTSGNALGELNVMGVFSIAGIRLWCPVVAGILSVAGGYGQTAAQAGSFEAASIKPADPNYRGISINFTAGGGFNATNVTLRTLIKVAYEIQCELSCEDF